MLELALQPVWEGLAEHRWSEPQLVAMDEELAKFDFLADYPKVQKSVIFFSAEEVNYLRRHRDYATQFPQMGISYRGDAKFQFAIYRYMPGGWFYQSALKNGRTVMQYLPAVNRDTMTISPAIVLRTDAAANKAVSFFDPLDGLNKMFNGDFLAMGNFIKEIAVGQSSVNLARTAIALERYRLAHGGISRFARRARAAVHRKGCRTMSSAAGRCIIAALQTRLRKAPARQAANSFSIPLAGMKRTMAAWLFSKKARCRRGGHQPGRLGLAVSGEVNREIARLDSRLRILFSKSDDCAAAPHFIAPVPLRHRRAALPRLTMGSF